YALDEFPRPECIRAQLLGRRKLPGSRRERDTDGKSSANATLIRHRSRASFLYRQPTREGFSTVGTIVTIHRCGLRDRSSWTDRTKPKNLDPFKLSSAARPLYWA